MNYNYHTHTKRCGHASGSSEEYVLRAIEGTIEYMGFSDHLPLKFKDGSQGGHRSPFEEAEAYIKEIRELAEKYIEAFCKTGTTKREYIEKWLPIAAAAQMIRETGSRKELLAGIANDNKF